MEKNSYARTPSYVIFAICSRISYLLIYLKIFYFKAESLMHCGYFLEVRDSQESLVTNQSILNEGVSKLSVIRKD